MKLTAQLRQGKPWHLLVGVLLIAFGVALVFGGEWLHWDFWGWSWYHPWQLDSDWRFCYPGYLRCVNAAIASEIFDVAMGLVILGTFLAMIGSYVTVTVYENMPD